MYQLFVIVELCGPIITTFPYTTYWLKKYPPNKKNMGSYPRNQFIQIPKNISIFWVGAHWRAIYIIATFQSAYFRS